MDNSNSSLGKVVKNSNACSSCEFANQYRPIQKKRLDKERDVGCIS